MQLVQRIILALLVSFGLAALLGPIVLPLLKKLKLGQNVRQEGPQSHLSKQGTPTMGGIILAAALAASLLLFAADDYTTALPALVAALLFGLIGFLDDFIKVAKHRSLGLRAWQKIVLQFGFALLTALWLYNSPAVGSKLYLPLFHVEWDLGVFYVPFAMFILIGTVNAVNLTDGLDGLASTVTMIYAGAMAILIVVVTELPTNPLLTAEGSGLSGMGVFCASLCGACMGFLVKNAYPAKVFMGDTGSFLLGGSVAMIALATRSALVLPLMGFCYVGSALSVIIQVGSYKLRNKKRVFKMAPIHHHFELCGIAEPKIVAMYGVTTALLCALAILLYTI